jgi:hypothetical protein
MNELKNVFSNQEDKIVVVIPFIVLFILLKQPIILNILFVDLQQVRFAKNGIFELIVSRPRDIHQ